MVIGNNIHKAANSKAVPFIELAADNTGAPDIDLFLERTDFSGFEGISGFNIIRDCLYAEPILRGYTRGLDILQEMHEGLLDCNEIYLESRMPRYDDIVRMHNGLYELRNLAHTKPASYLTLDKQFDIKNGAKFGRELLKLVESIFKYEIRRDNDAIDTTGIPRRVGNLLY